VHHMVRNIVGSLIEVGTGNQPVEWMKWLLEQKDRKLAAPTAKPADIRSPPEQPYSGLPACDSVSLR
jgi:tRNA pseudouridine(38-40) synthase